MVQCEILIIGVDGQFGIELQCCIWFVGWQVIVVDVVEFDFNDMVVIFVLVVFGNEGWFWVVVINGVVYIVVDKVEIDFVVVWVVNVMVFVVFVEGCVKVRILLVQVLIDYVFVGDKVGVWEVDDLVVLFGVYGVFKLGGEFVVCISGVCYVIVCIVWVVFVYGSNFVMMMLCVVEMQD